MMNNCCEQAESLKKREKWNYNWQTATALDEINWNKTAEDD